MVNNEDIYVKMPKIMEVCELGQIIVARFKISAGSVKSYV